MTREHLNLIFPQWQGAGPDSTLFYAAPKMAKLCPDLDFKTVPVPETCELAIKHGILGYDPILTQMKAAGKIISQIRPATILALGGDCSVEIMPVSWLNQRHRGKMTLVWLDAHADLNTPDTSPSGHFHGMPLATLLGLGNSEICGTAFSTLSPDQVILAGMRNPDPAEKDLASDMTSVSIAEMETSPDHLIAAIREKKNDSVYVHVDLDVLDPQIFPHVGYPEALGLMPATLIQTLKTIITHFSMAGLGLMEFTLPAPRNQGAMGSLAYIKTLTEVFR